MKKRILSIILVLIMCVSIVPGGPMLTSSAGLTPGTEEHVADDDTSDDYPILMDLRENSRRAGRVWADKSVFEKSITLNWDTDGIGISKDYNVGNVYDANGVTIINNSDFLHMFSALGSGVASQNIQALDVVFILDTSASMSSQGEWQFIGGKEQNPKDYITADDRIAQGFPDADINMNPRLEHAVDSINNSIDQIMEASAYNRVALVTFNLGAATVLPLDRYRPTTVVRTEKDDKGNITKYYSGGLHDGEDRYLTVAQVSNTVKSRTGADYGKVYTDQTAREPENASYDDDNRMMAPVTYKDDRFPQRYDKDASDTSHRFLDSQGTTDDWKAVEINAVSQTKTADLSTYIGVKSTTGNSKTQHVFWSKDNKLPYLHTSAGTDTYWGIHEGMNLLRTEDSSKLTLWKDKAGNLYNTRDEMPAELRDSADPVEVQRQPIIVLITDGAPNPESTGSFGYSKDLWKYQFTPTPSTSDTSSNLNTIKSEIARRDSANGFLVAASASYEKQLVQAKYNDTEVRMYNFGICMDYAGDGGGTSDTAHDGQVALAALNPASLFDENYTVFYDEDGTGAYNPYYSTYFQTIRGWWEKYLDQKQPVPLTSEKTSYTYTLNHPADDFKELNYATGFFPIYEPKSIKDELGRLLSEWLYPAHRAVIGDNDVGVTDILSYVDPIGQYMEVKDVRYVLLFGTLYNVEPGDLKYYNEVDPPKPDGQGNIITEEEVTDGDDINSQNYDYTKQFYKITSIAVEDAYGKPINNALTSMPTGKIPNPGYNDAAGNPDHQFSLDDIMIYVKDTGDYRDDTVQNVHADTGSTNQNLYIDIPTAALPMQVATITLNDEDQFVNYSTNIGLTDRDIDSSENLTEEYYTKKQQSTPIRVIYEVGIDEDILNEQTKKVDLTKVDAAYLSPIEDGGYRDGGKVYFYSNWYNREGKDYDGYVAAGEDEYSFGDAFVSFTANQQNRYYVFEATRLMFKRTDETDVDGTAVRLDDNGEYYTYELTYNADGTRNADYNNGKKLDKIDSAEAFKNAKEEGEEDGFYYILIEYYDREGLVQYVLPRKGSEFGFGTEADGSRRNENDYLCWYNPKTEAELKYSDIPSDGFYLAAKAGSLRVGDLSAGIGPKLKNKTNTADTYYMPTISNSTKTIQTAEGEDALRAVMNLYLGNNGRLIVNNNLLLITKQTTDIDGDNRSDADVLDEKEKFWYTVEIDDPAWSEGPHAVIQAVYEDKYHYDVWRALVDKLELLTGNYGFLWGNDGARSIVDENGNKYTEESTGPQYYVYVGGESGANPTGSRSGVVEYFNHENQNHDFADMLAGGKQITINAWLIPVDGKDGKDIDDPSMKWHFDETSTGSFIYMQNFVLGEIVPQDIGHAINMFYRSRVTYLTRVIEFKPKPNDEGKFISEPFTLRDGEGILINGLNENIEYTVTEKLEKDQVDGGIAFKKVVQVRDVDNDGAILPNEQTYTNDLSKISLSGSAVPEGVSENDGYEFNNNTSNENAYTYAVKGATTSHFAEEVHYYNYVPKVEKVELEHPDDGDYVEEGDTLTYIIDWENNEMDNGSYVEANVKVTDRLDPGVTHIKSDFVKAVKDANGNIIDYTEYTADELQKRGWKVEYVEATHTVTWNMPKAEPGEHGYVRVQVEVNEYAEKAWDYGSNLDIESKDNKVINKARVTVNDHELETNIVETPTWAPEKNETQVNGGNVTTTEKTTGNLVGPLVEPGDDVTYTISYENITETEADIVIVDQLDPGVEFVSAAWGAYTMTTDVPVSNSQVKIEYDSSTHKITWTLFKVQKGANGTVTLISKVKENAKAGWHYTSGLGNESVSDDDYKIFNRASVQIGNNEEQFTKIVENPLPSPFVDLPGVGGVGTEPFYLLGGLFILCALAVYTRKKRRTF